MEATPPGLLPAPYVGHFLWFCFNQKPFAPGFPLPTQAACRPSAKEKRGHTQIPTEASFPCKLEGGSSILRSTS